MRRAAVHLNVFLGGVSDELNVLVLVLTRLLLSSHLSSTSM